MNFRRCRYCLPSDLTTPSPSKKFWVIWCPSGHTNPTAVFATPEKALEIAEDMAQAYNDTFYVMGAEAFATPIRPVQTGTIQ